MAWVFLRVNDQEDAPMRRGVRSDARGPEEAVGAGRERSGPAYGHEAGHDWSADPIEISRGAERMTVTRPTRCVSRVVLLTLLILTFRQVVVGLDIEEAVHPGEILARMGERLGRLVRSDGRAAELPHDGSQQRDDPEEASVSAHGSYLGTNLLKGKFTEAGRPSHERMRSLSGI
jgi:hypothetical protein